MTKTKRLAIDISCSQESECEPQANQLSCESNTNQDEDPHLQDTNHKPRRCAQNSDHFLNKNPDRKTGGPIVGPPFLRYRLLPRKWALVFGPRPCLLFFLFFFLKKKGMTKRIID